MSFRGETAKHYSRYRRGYLPAVVGALVTRLALSGRDIVLDLGCGTGLLTIPLAARVGALAGMDPEPAMLAIARRAAPRPRRR